MHLVEGVVTYKKASGKSILDTKREAIIFEKVRSRVEDKRYQETIVATFSDILKRSRDYQDQNIKMKKEQFYPLGIFLAAMLGGLVRYLVSTWLPASPDFPWGTLLVNYLGIFCLVYLVKGYLVYKGTSKGLVLALGTGFCGGLTTFSSLMLDAVNCLIQGVILV